MVCGLVLVLDREQVFLRALCLTLILGVCVNSSSMSVLRRQKLNPLLSPASARRRVTLRRPGIVFAQRRADARKTDPQPEPLWIPECYMTCSYERPLLYGAGRTKLLRLHVETEILIVFVRVGLIVGAACYHGKQTRFKDRQLTCRPLHDESLNNSHTLWGWLCFWVENQIFIFCEEKNIASLVMQSNNVAARS